MFDFILVIFLYLLFSFLIFDYQLIEFYNSRFNLKKNSDDFINCAWLFVQLIYSGVVDPDNDQLIFTMIIDMLVVLIHHIITLEPYYI